MRRDDKDPDEPDWLGRRILQRLMPQVEELRLQQAMTEREIASRLEIEISAYGAWRQGRASPTIDDLVRLSDFLSWDDKRLRAFIGACEAETP